ncbi:MAG: M66 family metalloprotease, partial [Bacteroidaceae bacterium]|nr:M66 family metalloprotease [Bacteroidaceae bacterium]
LFSLSLPPIIKTFPLMKKSIKTTMLGGNWSGTCHLTLRAKKFWNDLIFKIKDYTVIFNITDIADQDGHFMNTFSLSSHQTNVNENVNVLGVTDHGNKILLYENSTKETAIHEIGHTLGLKHYPDDNDNIMYYNSYLRGTQIEKEQINDIIYFASKKKPDYDLINYRKVYMGQCLPRAEYGVSYKKNIKIINNKIK